MSKEEERRREMKYILAFHAGGKNNQSVLEFEVLKGGYLKSNGFCSLYQAFFGHSEKNSRRKKLNSKKKLKTPA